MKMHLMVSSMWLVLVCLLGVIHHVSPSREVTKRWPVIGVLAQSVDHHLKPYGDSLIFSSYVKFIEQAGALVIPVRIDMSAEYYSDLFPQLNGVVFPGGGVSLVSSPFAKAAQFFFNMAVKANDKGDFFPILGICLGFEELTVRRTITNKMVSCSGSDYAAPLTFTDDARQSRLFQKLPNELYQAMSTWNLTYNNHVYCMTPKVFNNEKKLFDFYRVMSTNIDKEGLEFISSMEAYKYPFYGTQWHPEKNIYQWSDSNVNHSALAVQVTQYIADFFVTEASKSKHHIDAQDLEKSVIFNYEPKYMGAPSFRNIYFFRTNLLWSMCSRGPTLFHLLILIPLVILFVGFFEAHRRWRLHPSIVHQNNTVTQAKTKIINHQRIITDDKQPLVT